MPSSFRNMTIIAKIAVPTAIVAVIAIGIVLYASLALGRLSDTATALVDGNAARVRLALEAESNFNSAAVSEKNVILSAGDEKAAKANIATYDKVTHATLEAIDGLSAITRDADEQALTDVFRGAVKDRQQASAHVFDLALAGKVEEAFAYSKGVAAAFRRTAMDAVGKLITLDIERMQTARDDSAALAKSTRLRLVAGAGSGLAAALALLGWIALRQISRPLTGMTAEMGRLAAGELEIRIEGAERGDEIGALARSLVVFRENAGAARRLEAEQKADQTRQEARRRDVEGFIAEFDGQVRTALGTLTAASTQMHATARGMSVTAGETSRQAMAVAETSDQAAESVQTVAAATEQMHASIGEITRQVAQSAEFAETAVVEADRTDMAIQSLARTAQKIGDVVTLIRKIAAQTNLLALNATIEAARAGEAGKGFSVVAGEVKSLASQTARATDEISLQIAAIQDETGHAVEAIRGIGGTIRRMNDAASTIAAAIEQQGGAMREISGNVQNLARGTAEVSANVVGVNAAADETGIAAVQVLTAADDLTRQTDTLRDGVSRFFSRLRSDGAQAA